MSSIAHFIVTRFNVRESASDARALDVKWLESRFRLFESFCLPTVMSQSEQNFKWLVLFDSMTPKEAREKIEGYSRRSKFSALFIEPGVEGAARKAVIAQLQKTPDILLTTRLDNDDGVSRTFVEDIQERAVVQERSVLDFQNGYVWHKNRIYEYHFPFNPFATLAEPAVSDDASGFRTVYTGSHSHLGRLGKVVELTRKPSWLQVVHGGNLENTVRGIRVRKSRLRGEFDISDEAIEGEDGRLEFLLDRLYTEAITRGRVAGAKLVKAIRRPAAGSFER